VEWDRSTIGHLSKRTERAVYIRELLPEMQTAEFCWRVVDARFLEEDGIITYFKAYGLDGEFLPGAQFGIHWDELPHSISGGFAYRPEFGNHYYVPIVNSFVTHSTGGYTAQVLDMDYPSEGLNFGMFKQGKMHQCLVVSFRLFELGEGYPRDIE
jgi:hypothetical protein